MQAVILAGGQGTRLAELTHKKPKPMIEIGNRPILWHIMKMYSSYSINNFLVCAGYKNYLIKEYFANYMLHNSNVTFDLGKNECNIHQTKSEQWQVTVIDTGERTETGGRLKKIKEFLEGEVFLMTYGDGLCDVNITDLIEFHQSHGKLVTMTAVVPPARFGSIQLEQNKVSKFREKSRSQAGRVNGGFFVLNKKALNYIKGDYDVWERDPLEKLTNEGQVMAFIHDGFWQPMDTIRDKQFLDGLLKDNKIPWISNS
ncbi:glucose-1-phosphate cytidylyltransferase [Betaproteobacteria bacterium]|nr:glucose-1-phosphate cytidylyltransferase [Betaproteobacteria bacterium]